MTKALRNNKALTNKIKHQQIIKVLRNNKLQQIIKALRNNKVSTNNKSYKK
ncbi:14527_t:CDS:2 [Cetraspora pellucida]|uniref:14527_t:CDS:1 n=1 Tax=Cetraspora pellucida TaxID=1433469 RepID=A0ACA9KI93_9GLOM|nr:14527_t:CDS:2 [Cetraspora pellucida]